MLSEKELVGFRLHVWTDFFGIVSQPKSNAHIKVGISFQKDSMVRNKSRDLVYRGRDGEAHRA